VSTTSFDQVITEHLTLSERNKRLEQTMPLDRYREESGEAASPGEEEPPTAANAVAREDPPSWWETEDGECPSPPLGWDGY
jgi:hypothetical protein